MRQKVLTAVIATAVTVPFVTVATSSPAQAAPRPSTAGPGGAAAAPVVVVRGLNNPRNIAVTGSGNLLVAEAGRGGDQCVPTPAGGSACFGDTGSISWVVLPSLRQDTTPVRVVTGLPSQATPAGTSAGGPSGVAASSLASISFVTSERPVFAPPPGADLDLFGTLAKTRPLGTPRVVADLRAYEEAQDPDGQGFESNPYAILALPGRTLVTDAAGNDILQVVDGEVSTFAVLPNLQEGACAGRPNQNGTTGCDFVPTGIAAGPDGTVYVGGLGGFTPGAGRVFQLDGRTGEVLRRWDGLTTVNGVAAGPDGSIYASQLFTAFGPAGPDFTTGKVTRIAPDGTRTDTTVPAPAGLAVSGGNLYVAAWTTAPATGVGLPDSSGQVWRLRI